MSWVEDIKVDKMSVDEVTLAKMSCYHRKKKDFELQP